MACEICALQLLTGCLILSLLPLLTLVRWASAARPICTILPQGLCTGWSSAWKLVSQLSARSTASPPRDLYPGVTFSRRLPWAPHRNRITQPHPPILLSLLFLYSLVLAAAGRTVGSHVYFLLSACPLPLDCELSEGRGSVSLVCWSMLKKSVCHTVVAWLVFIVCTSNQEPW